MCLICKHGRFHANCEKTVACKWAHEWLSLESEVACRMGPTPEQLLQIEGASYFNPSAVRGTSLLFSPSSLDPRTTTLDPGVRSEDSWSFDSGAITHFSHPSPKQPYDKLRLSRETAEGNPLKHSTLERKRDGPKEKRRRGLQRAFSSLSATHVTTS